MIDTLLRVAFLASFFYVVTLYARGGYLAFLGQSITAWLGERAYAPAAHLSRFAGFLRSHE